PDDELELDDELDACVPPAPPPPVGDPPDPPVPPVDWEVLPVSGLAAHAAAAPHAISVNAAIRGEKRERTLEGEERVIVTSRRKGERRSRGITMRAMISPGHGAPPSTSGAGIPGGACSSVMVRAKRPPSPRPLLVVPRSTSSTAMDPVPTSTP